MFYTSPGNRHTCHVLTLASFWVFPRPWFMMSSLTVPLIPLILSWPTSSSPTPFKILLTELILLSLPPIWCPYAFWSPCSMRCPSLTLATSSSATMPPIRFSPAYWLFQRSIEPLLRVFRQNMVKEYKWIKLITLYSFLLLLPWARALFFLAPSFYISNVQKVKRNYNKHPYTIPPDSSTVSKPRLLLSLKMHSCTHAHTLTKLRTIRKQAWTSDTWFSNTICEILLKEHFLFVFATVLSRLSW